MQNNNVTIENAAGKGDYMILCDHAVNVVPERYGMLGLPASALTDHIAWDPGALPISRVLAQALDAPLIFPNMSRLMIDCNRWPSAKDSIVTVSESTVIPGNQNISMEERAARVREIYTPFHCAIDALLDERLARASRPAVIAVHSFTPVYKGKARPWHVGILSNLDRRLADTLLMNLAKETELVVGDNEPYKPTDGVYHTLELHAEFRGLACAMIEIRNDLIATTKTQNDWAQRLLKILI